MSVSRFDALAVDSKNPAIYDPNSFERDTVSGARKWRWAVLCRWCVRMLVDACFAYMPSVWCEK